MQTGKQGYSEHDNEILCESTPSLHNVSKRGNAVIFEVIRVQYFSATMPY